MENFSHGSLDSASVIRVVGGLECKPPMHGGTRFLAGLIYARPDTWPAKAGRDYWPRIEYWKRIESWDKNVEEEFAPMNFPWLEAVNCH